MATLSRGTAGALSAGRRNRGVGYSFETQVENPAAADAELVHTPVLAADESNRTHRSRELVERRRTQGRALRWPTFQHERCPVHLEVERHLRLVAVVAAGVLLQMLRVGCERGRLGACARRRRSRSECAGEVKLCDVGRVLRGIAAGDVA